MISLFKPKLLIDESDAEALNFYSKQVIDIFGFDLLIKKKTIYPNKTFFDWKHVDNKDSTLRILNKLKEIMDIDVNINLKFYKQGNSRKDIDKGDFNEESSGTAGMFHTKENEYTVKINRTLFDEPVTLVATMAHELAHYKLLVEKKLEYNDEYLTEVLTVFYGLGIFSGNAAMIYRSWDPDIYRSAWKVSKQGYLNQFMWGYVMGINQIFKNEKFSHVIKHLNDNVVDSMKKTLKYFNYHKISINELRTTTAST